MKKLLRLEMLNKIYEQVRFFLLAILIAVALRSFLYEPFRIPSQSMLPTLLIGDYVFVSKFSYGYSRYSFPFGLVPLSGRVLGKAPERGDVAVFRNPVTPKLVYIKRIVGLPGDEIQLLEGRLYLNGEEVERVQEEDFRQIPRYRERLTETGGYQILEEHGDDAPADNTRVYRVPQGHYFAMGDNRDNSQDSRFLSAVGYIPEENLIGRAVLVWLSLDRSSWIWSVRLHRFFEKI